jgi:hypothetical protein
MGEDGIGRTPRTMGKRAREEWLSRSIAPSVSTFASQKELAQFAGSVVRYEWK